MMSHHLVYKPPDNQNFTITPGMKTQALAAAEREQYLFRLEKRRLQRQASTPEDSTAPNSSQSEDEPPLARPHWTSLPTEEPLTPELKHGVRMVLKAYYRFYRRDMMARMNASNSWRGECEILPLKSSTPNKLTKWGVKTFCNKPTVLYWAFAAQRNPVEPTCSGLVFGSIYKRWFHHYNDDPNVEFGHFFATPVRITSAGPTSLNGILKAHKAYCEDVSSTLRKAGSDNGLLVRHGKLLPIYKLLPICRAVIVVLDKLAEPDLDPYDKFDTDAYSQKQNVLLVRTGYEAGLSAPISFKDILAHSIPLARFDVMNSDNAIRVSLATAVEFIACLLDREEAALPDYYQDPSLIDTFISPATPDFSEVFNAEAWADTIMQEAEKKGIDKHYYTYHAVRRVKAKERGEVYTNERWDPYVFSIRWK